MEYMEKQLNHKAPGMRRGALQELKALTDFGYYPRPEEVEVVNLHCHTFFSFNAYGYSPSALAWLARQKGYLALGIVDFDVLDGVDEFLDGCELVGVRGSAGIETRVFIPEFADREINSPGEPGVYYHMGIGFTASQAPPEVAPILQQMRQRAERRNREMLDRLNAFLEPVQVDYDRDVLPLTPAKNATERHMLAAIADAAARMYREVDVPGYWAIKLNLPLEQVQAAMQDTARYHHLLRARLMKRGGVGYVQPGPQTFPVVEQVNRLIAACGALPCAAWLDGASAGEQAIQELLELLIHKGVAALNIIPDRNWNFADPQVRAEKARKLDEVIQLARALELPLNVGTEMNSPGQKLADDFGAPELLPHRAAFMDGAWFIYGHTRLQRACGLGWQSEWANAHFPARGARNDFYTHAGRLILPDIKGTKMLAGLNDEMSPRNVLDSLAE